jgi:signal transduction histidine kinase
VTVLAAGAFAVTLMVASFALLRALEGALVDDLRAEDLATLEAQAARVRAEGLPADVLERTNVAAGEAYALPYPGTQRVVIYAPSIEDLAAEGTFVEEVTRQGGVPSASAALLGIEGDPEGFSVSTLAVGGGVLATASPLNDVRDTLDTTRQLLWVIGPVLVGLVAALAWVLAGRALRPVHAVTSRVAAITSRSLHDRVPEPSSTDEIAELARTMNGMLGRLEAATMTSRRLVSDASHELRTPVAVMRAELEVARRLPEPDWPATADVIQHELSRLQDLVDDLLLLARADEQASAPERTAVSVTDVVHDVTARPRRATVRVDLAQVPADGSRVLGDERALRRAVDHLVANASRHATGQVVASVAVSSGEVRVSVDDDGPGIPVERRADVLRRFVRLDEARARDAGGAGLGLAVADDVARAHGGRVEIADAPLGGARVSLILPAR